MIEALHGLDALQRGRDYFGAMDVFVTGCYRDKVKPDTSGALRFAERIVVCDGRRFDTLVAIPF